MKETALTFFFFFFQFVLCVVTIKCLKYFWNRRWLYYHSFKIPGPYVLPMIGLAYKFLKGRENLHQALLNLVQTQPPIFKVWLGPELIIQTSRPRDLRIILGKCFDRGAISRFGSSMLGDGLVTSDPTKWSKNRKVINTTFNSSTLHSFIGDFSEHSNKLVEKFEKKCGLNSVDIFLNVYCCIFNATCESLLDIDASSLDKQENFIQTFIKVENLLITQVLKMWCHIDKIWNRSSEANEMDAACNELFDYTKKLIELNKSKKKSEDNSRKKRFLNHLLSSDKNWDDKTILDETHVMLIGASETLSLAVSLILVILGIYPEFQEKLYDEIISVVNSNEDKITLDHINQMTYLDAVIKEVLRIFPIVPITLRQATEDINLGDYTIPAGAHISVPIFLVHRIPKYWKNPDEFNPERFLSEEAADLPSCVFMPFSYGRRNCIGHKYALLLVKVVLSTVLRSYKFESADFKSIEEIEFSYHVVIKPKKGYKLRFQKRENNNNNNAL